MRAAVGLASHWVFRGLLYSDATERRFQLVVEALLATLAWALLPGAPWARVGWALLLAHTVMLLLNGHVGTSIRGSGLLPDALARAPRELRRIQEATRGDPSILLAAAYGSAARGEGSRDSDLDVRLVRRRGAANGIRACALAMRLRASANARLFPLDLYVLDDVAGLGRMRPDERPVVLHDPEGRLATGAQSF